FLVHSRSEREKRTERVGGQASVLSAVLFVFVLLVVSSAIPNDNETKYDDRFEALFMDSNFQAEMNGDYTHFSDMSGDAGRYRNFASRRLYLVGIDPGVTFPPYFKRQTFDFFDFASNRWHSQGSDYSDIAYTAEEWTELNSKTSLSGLREAIIRTDQLQSGFADKYNMRTVVDFDKMDDSLHSVVVTSQNFSAMYYLSPSRIVGIRHFGGRDMDDVGVTKSGVFRYKDQPHRQYFSYVVDYYDEILQRSYWFSMGGSDITAENEDKMLAEMYDILSKYGESELADRVQAFITIREDAYEYAKMTAATSGQISQNISELAHSITDEYEYEWEKANALATYFILNDYRYDLEYISPDESPEYFLFNSKRGSCSDYAAAYVLMARSVGLNARYCEGYSTDPSTLNDISIAEKNFSPGDPQVDVQKVFIVKDSCSHAYPEVFIPNIGWTVFEPTVPSDYSTITSQGGGVLANMSLDISLVLVVIVISGFILLAVILGVAFIPVILEKMFVDKLSRSEPDQSAVLAYERVRNKAGRLVKNADAHTAYELSDEVDRKTGSEFTPVAFMLERIVYGGGHADHNDKKNIIERYMEVRKKIKEYIKNNAKAERKKYR
ncbi:MAG: transglutaminase domain-containing protein, partial [Oscillospiraceae bacterium]|nr:transglutaminase domain-containing protein [Oscillospiraceae bacterium]